MIHQLDGFSLKVEPTLKQAAVCSLITGLSAADH